MPDVHAGKSVPVGTTMTIDGKVNPALVGVDIGCGMEAVFLGKADIDLAALDRLIHSEIPAGTNVRESPLDVYDGRELDELYCKEIIDINRTLCSIGTLGGGNHFIEVDKNREGELILVIHSGSRRLGCDVAMHYQRLAYKYQCKKARKSQKSTMRSLRGEDEYYTKSHRREEKSGPGIKFEQALLEGELFSYYMHDIAIVQSFADANRRAIAEVICRGMGLEIKDRFSCRHNYIDEKSMILRKGAISARLGERVIIPLNMRDGAILGRGLGNAEWNFSAPHGAGRVCSRSDAAHAYTVEQFKAEMAGIYTTTAEKGSLDECPMAYKPPERILEFLHQTVEVEEIIKPVYNFKAC